MFEPVGNTVQGPTVGIAKSLTATTSTQLPLTVWVTDATVLEGARKSPPGPPITITWSKFRGPGAVTFAKEKPPLEKAEFKARREARSLQNSTLPPRSACPATNCSKSPPTTGPAMAAAGSNAAGSTRR